MHVAYLSLLIVAQPVPAAVPPAPPAKPAPKPDVVVNSEEQTMKAAHLGADGPALLDFFRKRSGPAPDKAVVNALVAKLGDKTAANADKAAGELISLGATVIPVLRPIANNPDGGEATIRARQCLLLIDGNAASGLTSTAARLLANLKPNGTVETLLEYLPFADDDRVVSEIESSLVAAGLRDGKTDPALVKALEDSVPLRRAIAASVLCQVGGAPARALVRPLLKDPKPTVRLKVALAFIEAHDAKAMPILIDLLSELPPIQRKEAEDNLSHLAGEWAIMTPQGEDATSRRLRREMWHAWWRSTDGTIQLDEFRHRTLPDAERMAILDLIGKLSDAKLDVRKKAENDLLALGPKIAPLLRRALNLNGNKANEPVARCLHLVEREALPALPSAAPRLLALRRPEGSVEALLAYLPFAESSDLNQQIRDLVTTIAVADARSIPALVKALQDPVTMRRAAAAQALCKVEDGAQRAAVRELLADPDAEVRLRAALGLAPLREKEAVPVLIALLAELPVELAHEAEDYLLRVAGSKAPAVPLTTDAAARAKTRDAWAAWWKANAATTDLARVDNGDRDLGFMLIIESWDPTRRGGRVLEVDRAGKQRWEVTGLQYPFGAQILPGDRVLIAEQNLNRVTERDFSGKILWEKQVNQAFHVQRLRNGHTFIAGRNHLIEVDRDGKEILNQPNFNDTILAAQKLRDGQIAVVTYGGTYSRLDAKGKEVKTFTVPFNNNFNLYGEVLPNDHVIISTQGVNKVTEYDGDGKVVWETTVPMPGTPTRLANGNTLVPSQNHTQLVELDRTGKVVNEFKGMNYKPWRVSRR